MKYSPMKARIGSQDDLKREDYIYEPKLDGIRALCYVDGSIRFISRNDNDLTAQYDDLQFRKNIKARHAVLDGELVGFDQTGRPNFNELQQGNNIVFFVFDILSKDGKNLTEMPLLKRKAILEKTVINGNGIEKIFYTQKGVPLWKEVKKRALEGIVAKAKDGVYYSGKRTSLWLKIKSVDTIDCVILGYVTKTRAISSLALGLYDSDGILHYIGNVGTGFNEKTIKELNAKLKPLTITKSPAVTTRARKNTYWVKPVLVCEIKYLEFTPYMIIRTSVFLRLRSDKKPQECTFADQLKTINTSIKAVRFTKRPR